MTGLIQCLLASDSALSFGTLFAQATITSAITADVLCAGTLPSPLATSISATYLDVSDNQLTGLPSEWSAGFANATKSRFVRIYLQQNQIQVRYSSAVHFCIVVYLTQAAHSPVACMKFTLRFTHTMVLADFQANVAYICVIT